MKSRFTSLNGTARHVRRMVVRTISSPEFGKRRSRGRPIASRGRRFLLTAAVLSIAIHVAVALMIVLLPRVVSPDARPREEGTVELLMVEKKGAQPSTSGRPQEHQLRHHGRRKNLPHRNSRRKSLTLRPQSHDPLPRLRPSKATTSRHSSRMKKRRKRPHRQPTNQTVKRRCKLQRRRKRRYSISPVPKANRMRRC